MYQMLCCFVQCHNCVRIPAHEVINTNDDLVPDEHKQSVKLLS